MAGEPGSHVPAQISLCSAETGQRHPRAQCAFLVRAMGKPAPSCPGSLLSLGRARSVAVRPRSGGPPLAPPPRGFWSPVTPLWGRTRGTGEGRKKWVSAPPQRQQRPASGSRALRVANERFGMLVPGLGLGMLRREPPGRRSPAAAQALQSPSVLSLEESRPRAGRGGCVHSLFSFQGPGCAPGSRPPLRGVVGSGGSLSRARVPGGHLVDVPSDRRARWWSGGARRARGGPSAGPALPALPGRGNNAA